MKIHIEADGVINALRRAPSKFLGELRKALKTSATMVQVYARSIDGHRYTSRGGSLARSVQVKTGTTSATVYLDTGIAKYGPFIHQGWKRPKSKTEWSWAPDPFLNNALDANESKIKREIAVAIARGIVKAGLHG